MILEKMPTGKLESLRAEVEAMIVTKVASTSARRLSSLPVGIFSGSSRSPHRSFEEESRAYLGSFFHKATCLSSEQIELNNQ